MTERWERVARLLKSEHPISNGEVATRLRVAPRFVTKVRQDLGIPPYRYRRPAWTTAEFDAMTILLPGGHRLWRGRVSVNGTPMASKSESAYRVGFRLYHQREAVGRLVGCCSKKRCVTGAHRQDQVIRDQIKRDRDAGAHLTGLPPGATWRGMDLVAIRRAMHGDRPYPPLGDGEKKLAARFADPAMSTSELARRLDCCPQSARTWREKGAAS